MKVLLALALTALASCGPASDYTRNPELNDLVAEYIAEASARGVAIHDDLAIIQFTDNPKLIGNKDGMCIMSKDYKGIQLKRIYIHPRIKNDKDRLRAVMYHESAHCLQNAKHSNNFNDLMWVAGLDKATKETLDSHFANY